MPDERLRHEPISQDWIKSYVDQLLVSAERLSPGAFKDAILHRADSVLDLVKAWRERQ